MEKSMFQFSNPRIEKVIFKVNGIDEVDSENIPIGIEVHSEINEEDKTAVVRLDLSVGRIDEQTGDLLNSVYFDGCIVADFTWNDEIENVEKKLKINGGTVLLSYIRPILANLTMQAGMRPLHLPFINFT